MKTELSPTKQKNQQIKIQIYRLLEEGSYSKKQIIEKIEESYDVKKSEIRGIMKEIRSDFVKKLNILQSGVLGI